MRKFTGILIWVTVATLSIYDVFVLYKEGGNATISVVMWNTAQSYPIVPFAFGVLMGHLFWQFKSKKK